jgi:hypothetical protein
MNENVDAQLTSISKTSTIEEIGEYWDIHSLADHWDETHEVEFVVRAKRRHRVTLEPDLYRRVEAEARERGVLPETLINLWISERLQAKAPT